MKKLIMVLIAAGVLAIGAQAFAHGPAHERDTGSFGYVYFNAPGYGFGYVIKNPSFVYKPWYGEGRYYKKHARRGHRHRGEHRYGRGHEERPGPPFGRGYGRGGRWR